MTRALEAEGRAPDRRVRRGPEALRAQGPVGRRASRCSVATQLPEVQEELRTGPRRDGDHLRPALRGRGPPAAQAGRARGAAPPGRHQRGGVRGLRRLQHQEQLPLGAAARDRVRREAPDPRPVLQPRLHVPRRRLPVVRDGRRRQRRASDRRASGAPAGVGSADAAGGHAAAPADPGRRRAVRHLLHRHRRHRRRHRQPHHRHGGRGGRPASSAAWTRPASRRRRAPSCRTSTWPPTASALGSADRQRRRRRPLPVGRHPAGRRRARTSTRSSPAAPIAVVDTDVHAHRGHAADRCRAARPRRARRQPITERVGADRVAFVDSKRIAEVVFANHLLANVVLLGAAFQLGGLPLSLADIEQRHATPQGECGGRQPRRVRVGPLGRARPAPRSRLAWRPPAVRAATATAQHLRSVGRRRWRAADALVGAPAASRRAATTCSSGGPPRSIDYQNDGAGRAGSSTSSSAPPRDDDAEHELGADPSGRRVVVQAAHLQGRVRGGPPAPEGRLRPRRPRPRDRGTVLGDLPPPPADPAAAWACTRKLPMGKPYEVAFQRAARA